jgi:propionyl-CoA carboxylase alpha chain
VYGLDLVALQLRVARGDPLGLVQDDIVPRGHAIEVRLYAEDPAQNYRPTPGPLHRYAHPEGPALRFEHGINAPGEISPFYDPMIAKVVARGDTRREAAGLLARALEATQIHGVTTNRNFLAALLHEPDFLAGLTRTDFLDHHPDLLDPPPGTPPVVHLAAAVAVSVARRRSPHSPSTLAPPGFRPLAAESLTRRRWQNAQGEALEVAYRIGGTSGDTDLVLEVDGQRHVLELFDLSPDSARVRHDGLDRACSVAFYDDGSVWVNDSGCQSRWDRLPRLPETSSALAAAGPVSELPGTVVAVLVEEGQQVVAGQKLVMVEAMKMEHAAVADSDGVVTEIHVNLGQYVEAKAVLVTLEPASAG